MALKAAVANGDWSNPTTWNNGTLPIVGDVVASNNFTVTINVDVTVNSIANTVQAGVSIVPIMTSNNTPSGIVTSSTFNPSRPDWRAFSSSGDWTGANTTGMPAWIAYEFTSTKIVDRYSFTSGISSASMPKDFLFQGWDGNSYITLHTVTGNASLTYTSPSIGNTTAYIKYRIYITAINQTNPVGDQFPSMAAIKFYEPGDLPGPTTAGGTFILNGGVTLTCTGTNGIISGTLTCLTFSGTTTSTINANASGPSSSNIRAIVKSGNGTLNFNGNLTGNADNTLTLNNNTGITNIVGSIRKTGGSISNIPILFINSNNTVNITGEISCTIASAGNVKQVVGSNGGNTVTITGNIDGTNLNNTNDRVLSFGTNDNIQITGNILGVNTSNLTTATIFGTTSVYLKIVGSIISGLGGPAIISTSGAAIHILTGPFICSTTGMFPLNILRMNYFRTIGSYFEFRDETTNGANPPAAPAPATRLVSPDTVVDSPIPANVRNGVNYALGTLTGTLAVPSPGSVALGVPTDNTVGTAVLTPDAIWNYATANLTDDNSIGARLKNVSTVDTTGSQLASLL